MTDVSELSSDNTVYKTLLESTRAIPWKIDCATMQFAYIGLQIEPLPGWSQAAGRRPRTGRYASTRMIATMW
ncbi:hypothetical protein [Vogesella sp. EB]|uniref:hypothetical protein n=1 Tax=Vogesella sp. EB TaxID=1526735 RepID=UPI001EE412F7|nr:hypothetical protein [Vogesella sp. EB]